MIYVAFIFALALACVAGMEFISLMTLETRVRQLKRRVKELEHENLAISEELRDAEERLKRQSAKSEQAARDEEAWPEFIDDNSLR